MGFDTGPADALNGKRVTMQFTGPDGSVREISVTENWLAEQERNGKMSQVVPVHVADPIRGCHDTLWKIGEDIDADTVTRRADPSSGSLYAIVVYTEGKPQTYLCDEGTWREAKDTLQR